LANLNRLRCVDVVLSSDGDTLVFGALDVMQQAHTFFD
jgi:hypothetical protein